MPKIIDRMRGGWLFGYSEERKSLKQILIGKRGEGWIGRGGDRWTFNGYYIDSYSPNASIQKTLRLEEAFNEPDGDLYVILEYADEFDGYPIKNLHQDTVTFIAKKRDQDEVKWTETELMEILSPIMGSV